MHCVWLEGRVICACVSGGMELRLHSLVIGCFGISEKREVFK